MITSPSRLVPVPIPDRVAAMIGACLPLHVLQAEVDADCAAREVYRFRGPLCAEDRADREHASRRSRGPTRSSPSTTPSCPSL